MNWHSSHHFIFTDHAQQLTASAGVLICGRQRFSASMIYGSGLRSAL